MRAVFGQTIAYLEWMAFRRGTAPLRRAVFAPLLVAALTLSGCGGGSGESTAGASVDGGAGAGSAATASLGQVALFLTDRPADLDELEGFHVTFSGAALVSAAGEVVPILERARRFDLLRLRAEQIPMAIADVPAGVAFETLRLKVDMLELSFRDGRPLQQLPIAPILDLPLANPLVAGEGGPRFLQVDWDVAKSLLIEGNTYIARPVTLLDVEGDAFETKLARLRGRLDALNGSAGRVRVCDVIASDTADTRMVSTCLELGTTPETSLFDGSGRQRPASDLFSDPRLLGTGVKVWARSRVLADTPAGEERIFEALVVQLGEPLELTGTIESAATGFPGVFVMRLDPGQLPVPPKGFRVALASGTKIVNETGGSAEVEDISVDGGAKGVRVQGIAFPGGRDDFSAAMVFVSDEDDPDDSTTGEDGDGDWLRGDIQERRGSQLMVVSVNGLRCGGSDGAIAGDMMVSLRPGVTVRRLTTEDGRVVSAAAEPTDLSPNQSIEAFGSCKPGRAPFQAEGVLILDSRD